MTKEEVINKLEALGVKLYVGSCGCCFSPWIKIEIDGLTYQEDGEDLDMFEQNNEEKNQNV